MRTLDVLISWLKARVASVNNARIVPEPDADLVEADAGAGKQTGECVPHGVWRNPFKPDACRVVLKRAGELVTVTILSVDNFGTEHVRFFKAVPFQELYKGFSERDGTLFPILEHHRGSLPQMQQLILDVEPKGTGFYYLILS